MAARVYALWKHPIFHDSVHLILQHPEVEWAGGSSDLKVAQTEILNLQPDIILLERTEENVQKEILEILESKPSGIRVFALNLNDNQLLIYKCAQKTIANANDLIRLVLDDP